FPQDRNALEQMPKSALIDLLLEQQVIEQLVAEVERLKRLLDSDSKTSSKPPFSDFIKRSETPVKPKPTSDLPHRADRADNPVILAKLARGSVTSTPCVLIDPPAVCPICQ
ncbi:hypothetical protein KR51_00014850, partial [Rubidibacter lacunae KORDI 51-2]